MRSALVITVAASAALGALSACDTGLPAGAEPHHELNFLDMADQPKMKPQRAAPWRVEPPIGAVAMDFEPYPYAADQGDRAGLELRNPLARNAANEARGKFVFENLCIACHGPQAAGDGEVAKLFPKPPHLMTERVRVWSDGRIFHVPMRGQASMPSHAKQLSQRDIWAVVLHLRKLQSELPVAPPDPTRPAAVPVVVGDAGIDDAGLDAAADAAAEALEDGGADAGTITEAQDAGRGEPAPKDRAPSTDAGEGKAEAQP